MTRPNAHLGFSAENQECFDERWSHMRKLAAAGWKVWCSAEPLLGPIDASDALRLRCTRCGERYRVAGDCSMEGCQGGRGGRGECDTAILSQIVVGAESGHGARPMDIEWVRSILRQCEAAGTAAFVKQIGAKPYSRTVETWNVPTRKAALDGCVAVFPELKKSQGWLNE